MTNLEARTPPWKKFALSVEEAADYFNIGVNKIRNMISDNPDAPWILWIGSRSIVKRAAFEKYLEGLNTI